MQEFSEVLSRNVSLGDRILRPTPFDGSRLSFDSIRTHESTEGYSVALTDAEIDAYTADLTPAEALDFHSRLQPGNVIYDTLHDYRLAYKIDGLYEFLLLNHCQYNSHVELAVRHSKARGGSLATRPTLDMAAGDGLGGRELYRLGARNLIGVDILPQAREAAMRRKGLYPVYFLGLDGDGLQKKIDELAIDDLIITGGVGSNHAEALIRPMTEALRPGGIISMTAPMKPTPGSEIPMLELFQKGFFPRMKLIDALTGEVFHRKTLVAKEFQTDLYYHAIVAVKV